MRSARRRDRIKHFVLGVEDPDSFEKLVELGRKSWALPVCLSPKSYPTEVKHRESNSTSKLPVFILPDMVKFI